MSLDADTLGDLIAAKLKEGPFDSSGVNAASVPRGGSKALDEFCGRVAAAIVEHIVADAEVVDGGIT